MKSLRENPFETDKLHVDLKQFVGDGIYCPGKSIHREEHFYTMEAVRAYP